MNNLWWLIPFGALMLWCVIQFFRGGGGQSDGGERPSERDEGGGF